MHGPGQRWDCKSCQKGELQDARNCSLPDYDGVHDPDFLMEFGEDLEAKVCPVGLITGSESAMITLFFHTHASIVTSGGANYIQSTLLRSGGLLDQSHIYVESCQIIRGELAVINVERVQQARTKK